LFELHQDPVLTRYAGGQKTREESSESLTRIIRNFSETGLGALAVEDRGSGEVIGWVGVQKMRGSARCEIIYALRPERWGQGLALEASVPVIRRAFLSQLRVPRIFGLVFPQNQRSVRVLQKLGMSFLESILDEHDQPYASLYAVEKLKFLSHFYLSSSK
jgi:RimJ/RimL family protein N-acetyltransferase